MHLIALGIALHLGLTVSPVSPCTLSRDDPPRLWASRAGAVYLDIGHDRIEVPEGTRLLGALPGLEYPTDADRPSWADDVFTLNFAVPKGVQPTPRNHVVLTVGPAADSFSCAWQLGDLVLPLRHIVGVYAGLPDVDGPADAGGPTYIVRTLDGLTYDLEGRQTRPL